MPDRLREALAEVSAAATAFLESATDYEQLLTTIARSCARALRATGMVTLFDAGETMTHVAAYDDDPGRRATYAALVGHARPLDVPLFRRLQADKVIFLPELDVEAMRPKLAAESYRVMTAQHVTGMIAAQLRVHEDVLGVLTVLRHGDEQPPFDDLDRDLVVHIANVAAMALANARLMRRAHSLDALRESEQRAVEARMFLDAIVDNIPAVVFVKDAMRLSYIRVNRATEALLQLSRDQVLGKTDFDVFPRSVAEFFVAKDREALGNRQLVDIAEERITTPSGERWLHTRKVPIIGRDGEPRYLLGIAEDITERKRDLAALANAKAAAEDALRELEAYGDKLGDAGRAYCTRIREATERLNLLIDDLLARARQTR